MKQCQEEFMRKKNSIIQDLQTTQKSLLDQVKTNPRLWNRECFEFKLTSQANLVLKADLKIQDRAEKKQIEIAERELDLKAKKELEDIEANRKAKEEQDQATRKRIDAQRNAHRMRRRDFKYDCNLIDGKCFCLS